MDWQDNEFENFLKKFRLREPKDLPIAKSVSRAASSRIKIAAAAALIVAVGASAAIIRQLVMKKETPAVVQAPVQPPLQPPVQTPVQTPVQNVEKQKDPSAEAGGPIPPVPESPASPAKIDPKPPEPLKQLKVVVPPPLSVVTQTQVNPQTGPVISRQPEGEEDKQGSAILNSACGTCHAPNMVGNSQYATPQEYTALINRMINYGAAITPQQVPALADYLFRNYGKTTDRGKAILETACTTCHGLDALDNYKGTEQAGFRSLIDRMNAYGAEVKADQIDPLAEYLFKTYSQPKNQPAKN